MKDPKTILKTANVFYQNAIDDKNDSYQFWYAALFGITIAFESDDPIAQEIEKMLVQLHKQSMDQIMTS